MSLMTPADVAGVERDRLMQVARSLFPGVPIDPIYVFEKLQAEEAMLERELKVRFTPCEMVPEVTDPAIIAALDAAGTRYEIEPGYDYDPALFTGSEWGWMQLRATPLIAVTAMWFAYPNPTDVLFTIPTPWLRIERKTGRFNIVPVQSIDIPLNSYVLQVLGGSSTVPLMIQVRYTSGMVNARRDYPDLVDLIKRAAVAGVIEDQFLSPSGSVSVDGVSQSLSTDVAKYRSGMEGKIATLKASLLGPQMVFC